MKKQIVKRLLILLEFMLLSAIFILIYALVGQDSIIDIVESNLYGLLSVWIWLLILLIINVSWIAVMIETSFVKNPYLRTGILSFLLVTSVEIGWTLLYLTGLDGIA